MKKQVLYSRWNKDLNVCIGTDIPPISSQELMIFSIIAEEVIKDETNILNLDVLFEHFTYKKWERFEILSRLQKKGLIKKRRVYSNYYEFIILCKNSYRDSKEMRIYPIKNKKERFAVLKEFALK